MTALAEVPYEQVVCEPFSTRAITRNDFPGFREDYLAIHSLLRRYGPQTLMEIGTSSGSGTNVICNAMHVQRGLQRLFNKQVAKVYSIDVPPGTDPSLIYPGKEDGHPKKAGINCHFPYVQLFGDSTKFDFRPYYPLEAWFIDGKHDYEYAKADTAQALKSAPKLIVWHDLQINGVEQAVEEFINSQSRYTVRRVGNTRVGYAVKDSALDSPS